MVASPTLLHMLGLAMLQARTAVVSRAAAAEDVKVHANGAAKGNGHVDFDELTDLIKQVQLAPHPVYLRCQIVPWIGWEAMALRRACGKVPPLASGGRGLGSTGLTRCLASAGWCTTPTLWSWT